MENRQNLVDAVTANATFVSFQLHKGCVLIYKTCYFTQLRTILWLVV